MRSSKRPQDSCPLLMAETSCSYDTLHGAGPVSWSGVLCERGYRLLPEIKYLVVNAMIRLSGLSFNRTQGGPQQRTLRTTATGPAAAARKEGVGGLSFLSEDMHNTILSTCAAIDDEHNARCQPDSYSPTGELLNPAPGIEYDVDDMQE